MVNTETVDEALAKRTDTYLNAMIRFGERNQMIVAVEELSECQKETCKILRGGEVSDENAADRLEALMVKMNELEQQLVNVEQDRLHIRLELDLLKAHSWVEYCEDLHEYHCPRVKQLQKENAYLREAVEMNQRWVSVNERLPEMMTVKFETRCGLHEYQKSRPVLGADEDGEIAVVCIICNDKNERWWEDADESGDEFDIAYWMPFPEPPSTEGVE